MSKYDAYDKRLINAIQNGADTSMVLAANDHLKKLAEPHRSCDRWGALTPYYRVVDRRLQALRKKGVLVFHEKRWSVVSTEA